MTDIIEPEYGWLIIVHEGWKPGGKPHMLPHTIKQTRGAAIKEICKTLGMTWEQLRRRNFQAVKARIEVVMEMGVRP